MAWKSFVFFYISFDYIYIKEILYFKCKCHRDSKYWKSNHW